MFGRWGWFKHSNKRSIFFIPISSSFSKLQIKSKFSKLKFFQPKIKNHPKSPQTTLFYLKIIVNPSSAYIEKFLDWSVENRPSSQTLSLPHFQRCKNYPILKNSQQFRRNRHLGNLKNNFARIQFSTNH